MDFAEQNKITEILLKLLNKGKVSKKEMQELETWVSKSDHYKKLYDEIFSGNFPKEIASMLEYDGETLWKKIEKKIIYRNDLICDYEKNRAIIIDQPKIITEVRSLNSRLFDMIKKDPANIYNLEPREFELFVAELFIKDGYKVTPTQVSRDGGKDLFILEHRSVGNFLYYVECKTKAGNRPVGVNIIRELYGTVTADKATAGIVVTSSYFSKDAKNFTEKIKHQMSLIDYMKLHEWIKKLMT